MASLTSERTLAMAKDGSVWGVRERMTTDNESEEELHWKDSGK